MREALRWLLLVAIVLTVIGLLAYARGGEHRRGDDVGALRPGIALSTQEAVAWLP
jgi:hypothetical protein